jgi:hypothetical protein|nr:MAG TPA: hypothetical protein [Caudoviricetes sp.]
MDIILFLLVMALIFCFYMLVRNNMVHSANNKFIEYFYYQDPNGYIAGNRFENVVPSYDYMLLKFWVFPLSSFYPAYHNRNK